MEIRDICKYFKFDGELISVNKYGNGHINDTYLVKTTKDNYILQKMNNYVFKDIETLMNNLSLVTDHLKEKVSDPLREVLTLIKTKDNKVYLEINNEYYRAYLFIKESLAIETIKREEDFYNSALAFGNFQSLLSDFDAEKLGETIKDFHNTRKRYEKFISVVNENKLNKNNEALAEIEFYVKNKDLIEKVENLNLVKRVTHNDTKLNNVLFDKESRKGLCVIDLDTVMPGYSINDFGDSIRFGATYAAEDEENLDLVHFELTLFEIYTKGFIEGTNNRLTEKEILSLPLGAIIMTYECGMRFLTDFLEGDVYFKVSKENHNLIRTRTQIKLASEMLDNYDKMVEIVRKYM